MPEQPCHRFSAMPLMDRSYQILGFVEMDLRSTSICQDVDVPPTGAAIARIGYRLGVVEIERHEDAQWAMISINPEKGEPATGWVLDIFGDGERLIQKVVELEEPQSREQCVLDAEQALSAHYSVSAADAPPSARAERRWWLTPQEDPSNLETDGTVQDGKEWTGGIMSQRFPTKPVY
jgi:hypothetical protein